MNKKQHIISSLVFIVASGIGFFACYSQLEETSLVIHPYLMPTITLGLMFFLCVLRLIVGLRMPTETGEQAKRKLVEVPLKSLITMGLVMAYALCLKPVGFILTTFTYMMAQMVVLNTEKRNWLMMIGISLIMSVGVYFLFVYVFNIMLPAGVLSFL